ncbi:transcription antitermination factor NusB [Neoasaia chiangmaiensis NBRC 101099]|uniref:Transcription antitermination protein NusB n=1 Tax=Neoasaia chiangmaiensis TaxID=320497 RepID=A0A1U9KMD5_9PROT|nr:transcription antitermination factor NusB [Neoasaia chiangmaiensis]AQS86956.1 transcription antitermination factor NusB [Neoasaia chiangmaiensis]GBR37684.1 transcription antitermination factor NusB [Neoasaia chiangmaiensis NBRC 101099]GEN15070.1 N utilization substance protein B [Neoasaia chiangmaiensis]
MNQQPQNSPKRSRTTARVAAVQALFQCEQGGENAETVIKQFTRHRLDGENNDAFEEGQIPYADLRLFSEVVRGVTLAQDAIDAELTSTLPDTWPLERLDPVLRALLRAGAFELGNDVAPGIVINEYLDIAHGFFFGDEPRMVNGILDALARKKTSAT